MTNGTSEANDPSNLWSARTSLDLPHRLEADATLRYVSSLPQPAVDSYAELTARIGWRATAHWDLSIAGQNLLKFRVVGSPRFVVG